MDRLTTLIEEYQSVIVQNHHKDRDCHFTLAKRWAYGDLDGYYIEHEGYLHEISEEDLGPYATAADAADALCLLLGEWIDEERRIQEESRR